jgi:hypothetical protein
MRRLGLALLWLLPWGNAQADHPLITEDTGVLGAGRSQLELHGSRGVDTVDGETERITHFSATLSRGITDRVDLQLDLPWLQVEREEPERTVTHAGADDVALGAKWRFYERGGFSAAFKPALMLPTGRYRAGIGNGKAGWIAGVAVAEQWRSLQLIGHLRYTANRNRVGDREWLRHESLALLWSATPRAQLVLDYGRETSPDPAQRDAVRVLVYGLLYALSDDADFGIGYEQGRSAPAEDHVWRAGVKLRW